jgi:molybdate transport system ATP-binding protein
VRIIAGDVSLALEPFGPSTILNSLPVRIMSKTAVGIHEVAIVLALGSNGNGAHILVRITQRSWDQLKLLKGRWFMRRSKASVMAQVRY